MNMFLSLKCEINLFYDRKIAKTVPMDIIQSFLLPYFFRKRAIITFICVLMTVVIYLYTLSRMPTFSWKTRNTKSDSDSDSNRCWSWRCSVLPCNFSSCFVSVPSPSTTCMFSMWHRLRILLPRASADSMGKFQVLISTSVICDKYE